MLSLTKQGSAVDLGRGEGWRERADASFRRARIQLQIWFQDLLTHAADANDKAGRCERMSLKEDL